MKCKNGPETSFQNRITVYLSSEIFCFTGYERSIPGNPHYTVEGTDASGIFNLKITNVTLMDEADYECQVGPYNFHKPIRAAAHLSVLRKFFKISPLSPEKRVA